MKICLPKQPTGFMLCLLFCFKKKISFISGALLHVPSEHWLWSCQATVVEIIMFTRYTISFPVFPSLLAMRWESVRESWPGHCEGWWLCLFLAHDGGKSMGKLLVPLLASHTFHVVPLRDSGVSVVLDSRVTMWNWGLPTHKVHEVWARNKQVELSHGVFEAYSLSQHALCPFLL